MKNINRILRIVFFLSIFSFTSILSWSQVNINIGPDINMWKGWFEFVFK